MIYVVKPGDTVDSIAYDNQVSVGSVIYDNQIAPPYRLAVGQSLFLNHEENENIQKRSIYVGGYAYPYIREEVLLNTLPYLTDISVFSYGFNTQGNLIPPSPSDQRIIDNARLYGVSPIMALTPLDEEGRFNNRLISAVVNQEEIARELISQVREMLLQKGFAGVNIDFEYILAEDRDPFTAFVRAMTEELNEDGFEVSVALAPKISANQRGLLYEGKDYRGIGEAANHVFLMTYEWGYTYGPPMAVAPVDQVRAVVEYARSEIESSKIDLGIPNYAYDWALPYVRGTTIARALGNLGAVQLAIEQGVPIQFDEVAQSPYFRYEQDGVEHIVWFEDVRSLNAKFNLVEEYDLRGVGYWQLMRFFRANWQLLESRFQTFTS